MKNRFPKILIISRGVWDDTKGVSSTLTNLFEDYDANKLAHVYIETTPPNTKCCHLFFQISEISLVHKLYKWRIKTGHPIDTLKEDLKKVDDRLARQEAETMSYVRSHRSWLFSFLREVLWAFNGWKSKELKHFILNFDPDVIWLDGSPLPLMNRLYDYVLRITKKPATIFMQDDIYTYKSCGRNFWAKIRKTYLRKTVRKVVGQCSNMFVASPKMKREYDKIFGFNSIFIAKSVRIEELMFSNYQLHNPIRLVYMGQVIYGRIYSLISIAETLKNINMDGVKIELFIYTNNQIPNNLKEKLLVKDSVFLMSPVSYEKVSEVIKQNDVVVFVESFEPQFCKVARLSFSTKICDYLASGKCIFAVGPADVAPMEYFKEENAAIVANTKEDIEKQLKCIVNQNVIDSYAIKARQCAERNHDRNSMNNIVYGKLFEMTNRIFC